MAHDALSGETVNRVRVAAGAAGVELGDAPGDWTVAQVARIAAVLGAEVADLLLG